MIMIIYFLFGRTGPSIAIGFVLLEAGSGLWPFFYDGNIDCDVDGDGHGGDDDTIFVTRRTFKLSRNRLYSENEKRATRAP